MPKSSLVALLLLACLTATGLAQDGTPTSIDLTTPLAARRLGAIIHTMDLPLGGRQVRASVKIVDGTAHGKTATAHGWGEVCIHRVFLEDISGMKIRSGETASLNAAVKAITNNARLRGHFEAVLSHELGHYASGHLGLRANKAYGKAAARKYEFYWKRMMDRGFFRSYRTAAAQYESRSFARIQSNLSKEAYRADFAADRKLLGETCAKTGDLGRALQTMDKAVLSKPYGKTGPPRPLRLLQLVRHIERSPELFRPYLRDAYRIRIGRDGIPLTFARTRSGGIDISGTGGIVDTMVNHAPSLNSHLKEYMADEHAVISRYRRTGQIRRAFDLFTRLGAPGDKGVRVSGSHPSLVARKLNALHYIEAHPEVFLEGLGKPVHLRIFRDLPAVKVEAVDGKIRVTGRSAIQARLTGPERLLLDHYRGARLEHTARIARARTSRLPWRRNPRTTERYVTEAAEQYWKSPDGARKAKPPPRRRYMAKIYDKAMVQEQGRLTNALLKEMGVTDGRNGPRPRPREARRLRLAKATNSLSRTSSTLFTIMLMNAASQYYENGQVDVGAAIKGTLDSPEVWGGIAAAGAVHKASQGLAPRSVLALQKRLLSTAGARGVFARNLLQARGCIAAMVTFEVVGGYIHAAGEGLDENDGHLTVTELFAGKGRKGKAFLRKLGRIVCDPKAHAAILGSVFKKRILTAEFGMTVAGMIAGGKVGALALSWAGPIGAAVGGIVGGVIGGIGGSIFGAKIDEKITRIRYRKALEHATRLAARGPRKATGIKGLWRKLTRSGKSDRTIHEEDLGATFEKITSLRGKLTELASREYGRILGKLSACRDENKRKSYEERLAALRDELQALYLDEMDLLDEILEKENPPLGRHFYVERENATFSEFVLFMSQLDDARAAASKKASKNAHGLRSTERPPEAALSFAGMERSE